MQVPWQKKYYRPYLKDVMRSVWGVFTDVCLSTGGGTPWSLVPDPYPVYGLRAFLGQEGLGLPQSCDWSCPKSCTRSFPGHGRRYPTTENQDRCACAKVCLLRSPRRSFLCWTSIFNTMLGTNFPSELFTNTCFIWLPLRQKLLEDYHPFISLLQETWSLCSVNFGIYSSRCELQLLGWDLLDTEGIIVSSWSIGDSISMVSFGRQKNDIF